MSRFHITITDPDALELLDNLGRKKSIVIEKLILWALDEGRGYLPGWLMVEAGFGYKIKNSFERRKRRAAPATINKTKEQRTGKVLSDGDNLPSAGNQGKAQRTEPHGNLQEEKKALPSESGAKAEEKTVIDNHTVSERPSVVPTATDINMDLISKGLGAFGI